MSEGLEKPALRADLEWIAQPAPGVPTRHLVRDPTSGRVVEMSGREAELCRLLDGSRTRDEARARLREARHVDADAEQVDAFIRLLGDAGFLVGTPAAESNRLWDRMRPLPFAGERTIARLARLFGWMFSLPAVLAAALPVAAAAGVVAQNGAAILSEIAHLPEIIRWIASLGIYSAQTLFRIALILVVVPFAREVAKAVACRRLGYRVPEIRYLWFMRFIPRAAADLSALARIPERGRRLAIAAAGLYVELLIFSAGTLAWAIVPLSDSLHSFAFSVALGSAIGLALNAMPLGRQDGALLLALGVDEPNLRERAQRLFRARLLFRPAPEPMAPARRKWFILYGALADSYTVLLNAGLLALAGFLLTAWLDGLGAGLFAALVYLRFEEDIRSALMSIASLHPGRSRARGWLIAAGIALVAALACFIPYPYEVGGEFRVQPARRVELRAEIRSTVDAIEVAEAAWVTNGQVIARLSDRQIRRELDMTRAALERERSALRNLEAGPKPEDVARAEQEVRVRETAYAHAARRAERQREMYEKKHISENEYEEIVNLMNIAREELELARRQLELTRSGARPDQIAAQRAEVERLEINARHLEDDLARTVVTSPMEGRIASLHVQARVGQPVEPGTVLATVEDTRTAVIRIAVPEQFGAALTNGAAVRARPWAWHGDLFRGRVEAISPVVVERTDDIRMQASIEQDRGLVRNLSAPEERVVPVTALIENEDGRLKSEMTGYAKIDAGWKPLGSALFGPIIRFLQVRVWSWIP